MILTAQEEIIHCYEQIAPLSSRMLEFARTGNWDGLSHLGRQFRGYIDRLKEIQLEFPLDHSQLARKHVLLSKILADDAAIRDIVTPELAQLSNLLGNMHRQQHLNHAYGQ